MVLRGQSYDKICDTLKVKEASLVIPEAVNQCQLCIFKEHKFLWIFLSQKSIFIKQLHWKTSSSCIHFVYTKSEIFFFPEISHLYEPEYK